MEEGEQWQGKGNFNKRIKGENVENGAFTNGKGPRVKKSIKTCKEYKRKTREELRCIVVMYQFPKMMVITVHCTNGLTAIILKMKTKYISSNRKCSARKMFLALRLRVLYI